jgi:predicted SpoU family rRNA methylase
VAALSVFLDRLFDGKELEKTFTSPKLVIKPQLRGKIVEKV